MNEAGLIVQFERAYRAWVDLVRAQFQAIPHSMLRAALETRADEICRIVRRGFYHELGWTSIDKAEDSHLYGSETLLGVDGDGTRGYYTPEILLDGDLPDFFRTLTADEAQRLDALRVNPQPVIGEEGDQ